MEQAGEPSADSLYWVAVRVIRADWVAEWYASRIVELILREGLRLTELLAKGAKETLRQVAAAIERAGNSVEWCTGGRDCFTYNNGGVLVTVQREGSEIETDRE